MKLKDVWVITFKNKVNSWFCEPPKKLGTHILTCTSIKGH